MIPELFLTLIRRFATFGRNDSAMPAYCGELQRVRDHEPWIDQRRLQGWCAVPSGPETGGLMEKTGVASRGGVSVEAIGPRKK